MNWGRSKGNILNVPIFVDLFVPLNIPLMDGVVANFNKFNNPPRLESKNVVPNKDTGLVIYMIKFTPIKYVMSSLLCSFFLVDILYLS